MKYDRYNILLTDSPLRYEFYSEGSKGKILKRVEYTELSLLPGVYSLSFGDVNENNVFDVRQVTNNGDSTKVLASVATTALLFFDTYPENRILIIGSNDIRTRLYRMLMANNLEKLRTRVHLFGVVDRNMELFKPGVPYQYFLVDRKNITF